MPKKDKAKKVTIVYGKDEQTGITLENEVVPAKNVQQYLPDTTSRRLYPCSCGHDKRAHNPVTVEQLQYGIKGGRCYAKGCNCELYKFGGVELVEEKGKEKKRRKTYKEQSRTKNKIKK